MMPTPPDIQACAATYGEIFGYACAIFVVGVCIGSIWQLHKYKKTCVEFLETAALYRKGISELYQLKVVLQELAIELCDHANDDCIQLVRRLAAIAGIPKARFKPK